MFNGFHVCDNNDEGLIVINGAQVHMTSMSNPSERLNEIEEYLNMNGGRRYSVACESASDNFYFTGQTISHHI